MFKRNKSYLLLTFLVLTGFGGRIHSDALPGKERKVLVKGLKEGKKEFFNSLGKLNRSQLDFRPSASEWSIRENVYHLALCENKLWNWVETAVEQAMNDGHSIKPARNLKLLSAGNFSSIETSSILQPGRASYQDIDEAIDDFKTKRSRIIKFVKTTTDDIRNCMVECPIGGADSYNMLVYLSQHTEMHIKKIESIKSNPNFPK